MKCPKSELGLQLPSLKLCTCPSRQERPLLMRAALVPVTTETALLTIVLPAGSLEIHWQTLLFLWETLTLPFLEEQMEVEIQNGDFIRKTSQFSCNALEINHLQWIAWLFKRILKRIGPGFWSEYFSENSGKIQLEKHNNDYRSWYALCNHTTCNIRTHSHLAWRQCTVAG